MVTKIKDNVFSQQLKIFRKRAGLTQEELAERLNLSYMTIRRWETMKITPRFDEIQKIAKILSCTESELLNGPAEDSWELRLVMKKAGDPQKGVLDMTNRNSNAALYIEDDQMAITLTAGYDLWSDDAKFEDLLEQLRRKRAIGLKTRREDW